MITTEKDRAAWRDDAYDLLGRLLAKYREHLSPRVLWEIGPGYLLGRTDALLTNEEAQKIVLATAQLLGLAKHDPAVVEPGMIRLLATTIIDQIEVTVTAVMLEDPTP